MSATRLHTILTALSLVLGIGLVEWIQPDTTAGASFIVGVVVVLVNAVGALVPSPREKPPSPDTKVLVWLLAGALLATQAACAPHATTGGGVGAGFEPPPPPPAPPPPESARGGAAPAPVAQLYPARTFLRAGDIPPQGVGAYGVVALPSLPTPATRARLLMACQSFTASLPTQQSLSPSVLLGDQMLTIWPLRDPRAPQATDTQGDAGSHCDFITDDYDLNGGLAAIRDARAQGHHLTGRGPFLIGWSPASARGVRDAVVLVIDMSAYNSQTSFDDGFRFWQQRIVEDPQLWRRGFSLRQLRVSLKEFADQYGAAIQKSIKF